MGRALHEDFSRGPTAEAGSERAFGIVFAAVFTMIGLWPLLGGEGARLWSLALGGMFLVAALVRPALLAPLNRLWSRLGRLLHGIATPLVMGLLFFTAVTPTALVMRALGKNPLRLRFDRRARTYWIERRPPGPEPETMRNQF
ncbi:MAG: SxtJ family membrane protein [Alphaproteobacteria bacterium]